MSRERSEVDILFEKQKAQRAEFVRSQIRKLNAARYDWKLPKDFKAKTGYQGQGLITANHHHYYEVLSPREGLIYVYQDTPRIEHVLLLGSGITGSGITHLESLERTVNETLAQLSSCKSPLDKN